MSMRGGCTSRGCRRGGPWGRGLGGPIPESFPPGGAPPRGFSGAGRGRAPPGGGGGGGRRRGGAPPLPAVPTIVFHGDRDTTVHPSNGNYGIEAAKLHSQTGEAGGRTYTRTLHRGRPLMEHWLVHGAGHAWSGGSAKASYTDPSGPDATRE